MQIARLAADCGLRQDRHGIFFVSPGSDLQLLIPEDLWLIVLLQFEGKFTDEFAQTNRNEHETGIEAPGVTSSKKLKHAVASEKIHQGVISGTNNPDSQKCSSEHIKCDNGLVSHSINSSGDCKDGSNAFPSREENTISETRCPTDNWNPCQFALSNGLTILNNHSAPQDSLTYGDNDLNYIDWPGIDNFEDLDTLFRYSKLLACWLRSKVGKRYSSEDAIQAQKKTVNVQQRQSTASNNVGNRHTQTLTRRASYP
ncbi:hypothetical protein BAE44_0025502, partial [Dichanthelium oligosanthes]